MGSPTASPRLHLRSLAALAAACVTALAAAPQAMAATACESANAVPSKSNERTVVRATLHDPAQRDRHGLPRSANKHLSKDARGHAGDMDAHYFSPIRLARPLVDRIRLLVLPGRAVVVGEPRLATRGNAAR